MLSDMDLKMDSYLEIHYPSEFSTHTASRSVFKSGFPTKKAYSLRVSDSIVSNLNQKSTAPSLIGPGEPQFTSNSSNKPSIMISDPVQDIKLENILSEESPLLGINSTEGKIFGTFQYLFEQFPFEFDEKLSRTYFHQLIDAMNCLYLSGYSHLNLTTSNIVLNTDFELKIKGLEHMVRHNEKTNFAGSSGFRAPEMRQKRMKDTRAADIYAAGILLFALRCHGVRPHHENHVDDDIILENMMSENKNLFWKWHIKSQFRSDEYFSTEFRELFMGMISSNLSSRFKIDDIRESKWYKGPIYKKREVKSIMKRNIGDL